MIQDRSSAPLRLLTYGMLLCPQCSRERVFVGLDGGESMHRLVDRHGEEKWLPGAARHITDAQCERCGYTFGRVETIVQRGDRYVYEERRAISDDVAAAAARRLLDVTGQRGIAPEREAPAAAADLSPPRSEIERRLERLPSRPR